MVKRHPSKRQSLILAIAFIGLISVGISLWFLRNRTPELASPFSTQLLASINFPLYYPTQLPLGYSIDTKSITQPQAGVVVLTLDGPEDKKIYMSQEIRPTTFNFGAYYNNFSDKTLTTVESGTIAVGHIDNGHTSIGSLATNRTWIIVNTTKQIDLNKLTILLKNLAVSH